MLMSEILNEEKRDKYCSDKCCGSDVKAEDCKCPPDCKGCNCNHPNVTETAGGMSAGAVASVANPGTTNRKPPKNKKKIAPNALDTGDNLMGGATIKR